MRVAGKHAMARRQECGMNTHYDGPRASGEALGRQQPFKQFNFRSVFRFALYIRISLVGTMVAQHQHAW
jgi:hypothetical protein